MTMLSQLLIEHAPVDVLAMPRGRSAEMKRIKVNWDAAVNFVVPLGYEDEAGFHYGKPSSAYARLYPDND